VKTLHLEGFPTQFLDLSVQLEAVKALKSQKRAFVDGLAMFSLRRDELLQATLQVSRFSKEAKVTSGRFRNSVVAQIGSTTPQALRMGEDTVFLTAGRRQSVAVWFKDRYLFILSTRDDYAQPRSLLRTVLEAGAPKA
jgi:hypothetical protein